MQRWWGLAAAGVQPANHARRLRILIVTASFAVGALALRHAPTSARHPTLAENQPAVRQQTSAGPLPLYGLAIVTTTLSLETIDPPTGQFSPIGSPLPAPTGANQGIAALDSANHVYYFQGPNPSGQETLYGLNTQSGAIVSAPVLGQHSYASIIFDPTSGTLFGTEAARQTTSVVTIDPPTGQATTLTNFPDLVGAGQGIIALDQGTHRLFFDALDNASKEELVVVDTQTGSVLSRSVVPTSSLPALEFDQSSQTLLTADTSGLYSVDPASGNRTLIGAFSGVAGAAQGISSFDPVSTEYFFVGTDTAKVLRLYVVNAHNGVMESQATLPPAGIASMKQDVVTPPTPTPTITETLTQTASPTPSPPMSATSTPSPTSLATNTPMPVTMTPTRSAGIFLPAVFNQVSGT
jgi:hypothetical protein